MLADNKGDVSAIHNNSKGFFHESSGFVARLRLRAVWFNPCPLPALWLGEVQEHPKVNQEDIRRLKEASAVLRGWQVDGGLGPADKERMLGTIKGFGNASGGRFLIFLLSYSFEKSE